MDDVRTKLFSRLGRLRELKRRRPGLLVGVAWVTVIEGCNKACSFCVVPFTRGREVSRPPAAVLEEVERAVAAGAVEVELLGQNVNAYRHGATDLPDLAHSLIGELADDRAGGD